MNTIKKLTLVFSFCMLVVFGFGQGKNQNQLTPKEKKQGWVLLFDGTTSNGWMKTNGQPFPEKGWQISNGCLTVLENQKGGDIVTAEEYSDFELSVDFLIDTTANSGIKYFFTNYTKGGKLGMEYQVMDDIGASDNKLANHLCGSLYDIFPPDATKKKMNALGKWNTAGIVCRGRHVEHWLNGKKILEYERGSAQYLAAVEKSKYKTEPVFGMVEKGRILLQEHGHQVSFRNIKIRKY
ncbi:MAG: DUF1080 domain-containing protein [Ferruginibacter sp.]|nr:DUF1080 domain-containing protein [Ferruginibacter sp.]